MKNKVHFVNRLCELKGISPESEEGQKFYELKIIDLLIEIKNNTPISIKTETDTEEEEDDSLASRLGCYN